MTFVFGCNVLPWKGRYNTCVPALVYLPSAALRGFSCVTCHVICMSKFITGTCLGNTVVQGAGWLALQAGAMGEHDRSTWASEVVRRVGSARKCGIEHQHISTDVLQIQCVVHQDMQRVEQILHQRTSPIQIASRVKKRLRTRRCAKRSLSQSALRFKSDCHPPVIVPI